MENKLTERNLMSGDNVVDVSMGNGFRNYLGFIWFFHFNMENLAPGVFLLCDQALASQALETQKTSLVC